MFDFERGFFDYKSKKYIYEICFNKNDNKFWLAFFADFVSFDTKDEALEYLQKEGENLILEYKSHFPLYNSDGLWFLPIDDEERESMYLSNTASLAETNPKAFDEFKQKLKNASIWVKKRPKKAISLRVNEEDILEIKKIAEKEGIPYQTLISSILHKVATKQLKI